MCVTNIKHQNQETPKATEQSDVQTLIRGSHVNAAALSLRLVRLRTTALENLETTLVSGDSYLSGELWEGEALVWEGRVVHQVPVQHVEFIVCHDILEGSEHR